MDFSKQAHPLQLAPSVLTCNFTRLFEAVTLIEQCGCDALHCDVMDGVFVPPITFGAKMIADFRNITDLFLDVHCMVTQPQRHIAALADAGTNRMTFHIEAADSAQTVLQDIKNAGMQAGISLNPQTPLALIYPHAQQLDCVLVMSVIPGYGGQAFQPEAVQRIKELAAYRAQNGLSFQIEVDGGINFDTAQICRAAGADIVVCGNAFFKSEDPRTFTKKIQAL